MLTTSISNEYQWVLATSGQPDMRKAQNRDNVCDMVKRLDRKLKEQEAQNAESLKAATQENNVLKTKAALQDDHENECPICMEPCQGVTILKCGHSMCPECFAQHSRVNHTCPFCREEFAEKPRKQRENMPLVVLNHMAEQWTHLNASEGYFERMEASVNSRKRGGERQAFLRWFFQENGKIMMRKVAKWYDAEV